MQSGSDTQSRRYADYGAGPEPYYSPERSSSPASHHNPPPRYVNGRGNLIPLPPAATAPQHNHVNSHEQHRPSGTPQHQNRPQARTHFRPWEQQPTHNAATPEPQNTEPAPGIAQQAWAPTHRESPREYVESLDSDTEPEMPPTTRQRRNRGGPEPIVDITDSPASSSTSRQPRTRKRRADSTGDEGAASKRKRPAPTETVSLNDEEDEAPSADAELLKAQQLEALKSQQSRDDGPVKIGKRTCIICLENYTNATTSACGKSAFMNPLACTANNASRSHLLPRMPNPRTHGIREEQRTRHRQLPSLPKAHQPQEGGHSHPHQLHEEERFRPKRPEAGCGQLGTGPLSSTRRCTA